MSHLQSAFYLYGFLITSAHNIFCHSLMVECGAFYYTLFHTACLLHSQNSNSITRSDCRKL